MSETNNTQETLILCLTNGDRIIADVEEHQGVYVCTNVLEIISDFDHETGAVRMGTGPYLPYADTARGVLVPTMTAVVAFPSEEIKEHHSTKFSKIIVPKAQSIVLAS
jgi:hypothetical protein